MNVEISFRKAKKILTDPMYRNSIFISMTSFVNAGFGFLFWLVAARLYSDSSVGLATAMVSSLSLLVLFARLGLHQSIVRFFPEKDKNMVFTSSLVITLIASFFCGLVFILLSEELTNQIELSLFQFTGFLFLIFLLADSTEGVVGRAFIALKEGEHYFGQNLLLGSRLIFLVVFSLFSSTVAIFSAWGASFLVSNLYSLYFLKRKDVWLSKVNFDYLQESLTYSGENYLLGLLLSSPKHLVPIIVVSVASPEVAAYYYISHRISSFVYTLPTSFSISLFVEGSHGEELHQNLKKSIFIVLPILLFMIISVIAFGETILNLIGENYGKGYPLLVLMTSSSIFVMVFKFFLSIERVRMEMRGVILISLWLCGSLLGLSYFFISTMGIVGVGYAWLIGYGSSNILILGYLFLTNRIRTFI